MSKRVPGRVSTVGKLEKIVDDGWVEGGGGRDE